MQKIIILIIAGFYMLSGKDLFSQPASAEMQKVKGKIENELVTKYGSGIKDRIVKGTDQVLKFWREEDGSPKDFEDFVRMNFAADQNAHDAMFSRFQYLLEKLGGHMAEIGREFRKQTDLDLGEVYPFDEAFAAYSPSAHINDDFFKNKLAFVVLLNFPLTTLEQRTTEGKNWTRRQWAETRLAHRFSKRIPSHVNLAIAKAFSEADTYIADYNIWMHHVLTDKGERLFPKKMKLLSHWNLRDELKANYARGTEGLTKQRIIQKIMERIVDQSIPMIVINNPLVDWNPFTNEVTQTMSVDFENEIPKNYVVSNEREPDLRYKTLLGTFLASRKADEFSPTAPTLIDRQFTENRELSEKRVKAMLESVCSSPLTKKIADIIKTRLGRDLEPFDIWYNGFKPGVKYNEAELDKITQKKYPDPKAFEKDIPNILRKLGFRSEIIPFIANSISVDPARGSGHAMGGEMKESNSYLRTRIAKTGMDYKGYNIAVHELGHNVEQVLSLKKIDNTLLAGIPNTAFTEAFAFVFQARDKELLGLKSEDKNADALNVIHDFWMTYEIAGVALVDMEVWHWMYGNPKATPAELREAVMNISRNIWNKYYASVFNKKDETLLGIYSHMIHSGLYLPDYPIGHLIAFQIEEQIKKAGNVGLEFERMVKSGSITPDLWMYNATKEPVGSEALLKATEKALKEMK